MLPAPTGAMLRQARQMMIDNGDVPAEELVGHTVARSWRRCLEAGMAPVGRLPDAPNVDHFQFAHIANHYHDLLAHARPVMEYLHSQTRDSGSLVLLADDRGIVLQTLGDADFLSRAERVALMPGTSWHERHRGTNAIGTALAEACPVAIHGAEHFLDRNGFLTCAAAPVIAPDGRLMGVLDISGDQRGRHPHTFGLVRAAAQMIENKLFDAQHGDALRLRFHPLAAGIGTVAEGVVALSEDGWIVGANQSALALLGLRPADLGATPIGRVLQVDATTLAKWGHRRDSEALPVLRQDGSRLFVRVDGARASSHVFASRVAAAPPAAADALAQLDSGDFRWKAAIEKARKVIGKPIALLLQGESGVGKEYLAKAFHEGGPRRGKPFIAVNCATLPEHLIEAELFGYVPGAYTGARKEGAPGRIREADGGTLFLDEIGDMPLTQQARLLRVLQERAVQPVGSGKAVSVNFSLVCATHLNLKTEMEAGRFRADLYYRINGLTLMLPALRERSDFAALISRMLIDIAPDKNIAIDDTVMSAFAAYAWPGNLRQLANVLQTACAMLDDHESRINWTHLPDDLLTELRRESYCDVLPLRDDGQGGERLEDISAAAITRTVLACHGNISETARRLGISRNTLYRRLKRKPAHR